MKYIIIPTLLIACVNIHAELGPRQKTNLKNQATSNPTAANIDNVIKQTKSTAGYTGSPSDVAFIAELEALKGGSQPAPAPAPQPDQGGSKAPEPTKVSGKTKDALLQANDQLNQVLDAAKTEGVLADVKNVFIDTLSKY